MFVVSQNTSHPIYIYHGMYNILKPVQWKDVTFHCIIHNCHVPCIVKLSGNRFIVKHERDPARTRRGVGCTKSTHQRICNIWHSLQLLTYSDSQCVSCNKRHGNKKLFPQKESVHMVAWKNICIITNHTICYYIFLVHTKNTVAVYLEPYQKHYNNNIFGIHYSDLPKKQDRLWNIDNKSFKFRLEQWNITLKESNCFQHRFQLHRIVRMCEGVCRKCYALINIDILHNATTKVLRPLRYSVNQHLVYAIYDTEYHLYGYTSAYYHEDVADLQPFYLPNKKENYVYTVLQRIPCGETLPTICKKCDITVTPLTNEPQLYTSMDTVCPTPLKFNQKYADWELYKHQHANCSQCDVEYILEEMYWMHASDPNFKMFQLEDNNTNTYAYFCTDCTKYCEICSNPILKEMPHKSCWSCRAEKYQLKHNSSVLTTNTRLSYRTDTLTI